MIRRYTQSEVISILGLVEIGTAVRLFGRLVRRLSGLEWEIDHEPARRLSPAIDNPREGKDLERTYRSPRRRAKPVGR